MAMEFWGVQVSSKPCKVEPDAGFVLHISQATLGEIKKDNETVTLYVEIGEKKQKFVLGMLSKNTPQLSFDLVFDQAFEISHNWKNGSVHLLGYQAESGDSLDFGDDEISSDEDEEAVTLPPKAVAKAATLAAQAKKADNGKPDEDDDDDDDDDDSGFEDSSDDDTALTMSDDSDEDEDSSEDDDEEDSEDEKPSKVENGSSKKRPNADVKTPSSVSKKAKVVTPKKIDGKKEVHSATPHPMKKGGKTPGSGKATPKSGGKKHSAKA